jgi:hypothetical protein
MLHAMDEDALNEDWQQLRRYLPELEQSARTHHFTRRSTARQDAQSWLRLILMHAAGGLSLTQTVARAAERGWAQVSSVALHKRLRASLRWLEAITAHVLEGQRRGLESCPSLKGRVLRVVDATDVQEPGATGTDWRLHYSLRLPQLVCDEFELTDAHGAEQLARFAFQPGEVVLADRGYCHRAGVAQVLDAQAEVVVRLVPSNFPLQDARGRALEVLSRLASLKPGQRREWPVWFEHGGWLRPLRLCVLRKPALAVQQAHRKLRRKASRQGTQLQDQTLQAAAYVMILTSLPAGEWSTEAVLDLYRCRWQIELAFKRLKSLLQAGHVPKSNDQCARAWMQAKILTALLIESLLCDSRSFSPCSARLG